MGLYNLVLGNRVILSNILSYLDYSSLSSVRLVALLWNEIGYLQMKSFNLQLDLLLSEPEEVFAAKVQLLQDFRVANITISNGEQLRLLPQKWESLEAVLTKFGPQITNIELKFCLHTKGEHIISLFKTVFKCCKSARELKLNFDLLNLNEKFVGCSKNYSIRKLSFSKTTLSKCYLQNFNQFLPNVEQIEVDDAHAVKEFLSEAYNSLELENLKVIKFSNPKRRSRLCAKDVKRWPMIDNLVKLKVVDLHIDNDDCFYPHQLCNNFSDTLENFNAGFILSRGLEVTFPQMDKLQNLKLKFETKGGENCENVDIVFKVGHGLETKNFPNLKKLKIGFGLNTDPEQFIWDNFGSDILVNEGLEKFAFVFPCEEEWEQFHWLATEKFEQSFPNAEIEFGYYLP